MRSHDGFTITELLIVLILAGIIGGFAMIQAGKTLAHTSVQQAAAVIATDMKLAHSLAARAREPVRISIDTANRIIRVVDYNASTTVYSVRRYGNADDMPVERMSANDTTRLVFPTGLTSGLLEITVRTGDERRRVSMTRAGQVRITAP
jgi:prepilin-type N-terminal cleavage/methylation domain-containing protein